MIKRHKEIKMAVEKEDFIKVTLIYSTSQIWNEEAAALQGIGLMKKRFPGFVPVLLHKTKVFDIVQAYEDVFQYLKDNGAVDPSAKLSGFKILSLDNPLLSYVVEHE